VIAAARGERKLALARELGAAVTVDYAQDGWAEAVRAEVGERHVDVVYDGTGGRIGAQAFELTGRGSRFFSYGSASGEFAGIEAEAERRGVRVVGIGEGISAAEQRGWAEAALARLAAGEIRPVIGHVVPLERAADAHAAIEPRSVPRQDAAGHGKGGGMRRDRTVLVIGATGNVGRHVVAGLLEEGARVRALVRRPLTAALPGDVSVTQGDLERPETVATAAESADAAFLLWPRFSSAGASDMVTELARQVAHVVYLSAARLQHGDEGAMPGVWSDLERLIEASGLSWTFVRAGGFAANTLEWADQIRSGDTVRIPYPNAARSLVHGCGRPPPLLAALEKDEQRPSLACGRPPPRCCIRGKGAVAR
jgi:hypothetical protein